MNLKLAASRGFTLIEVMAAFVILATSLMAIILARNENFRKEAEANHLLKAVRLAEQKLAEFEIYGYPDGGTEEQPFPDDPGFTWQVSLQPVNLGGKASLVRLDLLVSYPKFGEPGALIVTTGFR